MQVKNSNTKTTMRIIIDARCKYNYSSYYILGIRQLFGIRAVSYQTVPFLSLSYPSTREYNSGMPVIFDDGKKKYKVFVDFEDRHKIEDDRYEWCDVYAKFNTAFGDTKKYPKLFVIGPAFGVTIDSRLKVLMNFMSHYLKARNHTSISAKAYLRDYVYSFVRRRRIEAYEKPVNIKPSYIFHASTLWYNEFAWTCTNKYRGEFLKACQKAGVEIEGGLFYLGEAPDILKEMPDYGRYKTEYKDFIYEKRLSMDDYILKTKASFVVFNTPAVCECHGWKLAEYLCMGKAIISTPLSREMPGEGLVHGKNIHFVHSTDEIYDAVIKIRDDEVYRQQLEQGARAYYEKYLAPDVVIHRIIEHAKASKNPSH